MAERLKFEDCRSCAHRRRRWFCRGCDVGELYQDEDAVGVDEALAAPVVMFGESVSDDSRRDRDFDAHRFAETLNEESEDDDQDPEH